MKNKLKNTTGNQPPSMSHYLGTDNALSARKST